MIYPYYPQLTDNETLVVPIDFFIQILGTASILKLWTLLRTHSQFHQIVCHHASIRGSSSF